MKSFIITLLVIVLSSFSLTTVASQNSSRPEYSDYLSQRSVIARASKRAGVPVSTMTAMAYVETRFQTGLSNKETGHTKGMYQFDKPTWNTMLKLYGSKYGYGPKTDIFNPMANALMAAELYKHNKRELERRLKRKVTDDEVYMSHFLGMGGASRMLKANPNRLARDVNPKAARYNKSHFYKKGKAYTVAEFRVALRAHLNGPKKMYGPEAEAYALMHHNYYYVS